MDDLTRALFRFFGPASGICLPPIPEVCRDRLMLLPPATFTTQEVEPKQLYLFSQAAQELVAGVPVERPEVTVSLFGHGMNSYAWTLRLHQPGLRVLMQVLYGGALMDAEVQAREVTAMFQDVHLLLTDAVAVPGEPDLVVLRSPFRHFHARGPAPQPGTSAKDWLARHSTRRSGPATAGP